MESKDIQTKLETLERELKDLKTIQGVIPTMQGYIYNYKHTGSGQQQVDRILEITFEDGDGTIFSSCMTMFLCAMLDIQGNKQRVFFRIIYDGSLTTFYSNRKILSVVDVT